MDSVFGKGCCVELHERGVGTGVSCVSTSIYEEGFPLVFFLLFSSSILHLRCIIQVFTRHCTKIQGVLRMWVSCCMGSASLRYSVLLKYKAGVSILHSKGMCLDAIRILLQCLSDTNQSFDMYLTVQTHQLRMMSSWGIGFDRNLRGHQSQARCESTS